MAVLDELLVGLGFEYNPEDAKKFNADYERTLKLIKGLAKAAIGAAVALTGMAVASTLASEEQGDLADEIGETVENIDALQFAMRRSGGTAEGMSGSLRQLAIRAAEAARGVGSGIEAFGILGISVTKADGSLRLTSDLLLEVSERFKTLGRAQQIELADKLGIRDSVRLLQQGPDAIRALTDEARAFGITTAEDAEIANEFQDSLDDLWQITKQLSRTLTKTLAPILTSLVTSFTDWWKVNRQMIEQNLPRWIDNLALALKLLGAAAFLFISINLATTLVSLITLFKGLTLAAIAANAALLFIPIVASAIGVAIALAAEDLFQFFTGGKSLIGDFLEEFPKIKLALEILGTAFVDAFNLLGDIAMILINPFIALNDVILDMFSGMEFGFSSLTDTWDSFVNGIESGVESIKSFLSPLTDLFDDPEVKKNIRGEIDILSGGVSPIDIPVPSGGVSRTIKSLSELGGGSLPANNVNKGQSTSIDKIEINVSSNSESPREVAREVMRQFQQTSTDLNSVVVQ